MDTCTGAHTAPSCCCCCCFLAPFSALSQPIRLFSFESRAPLFGAACSFSSCSSSSSRDLCSEQGQEIEREEEERRRGRKKARGGNGWLVRKGGKGMCRCVEKTIPQQNLNASLLLLPLSCLLLSLSSLNQDAVNSLIV